MNHSPNADARPRLFTNRGITLTTVAFVAAILAANRLTWFIDRHVIHFDRPPYWPISVFEPRVPTTLSIVGAAACLVGFGLAQRELSKRGYPLPFVIALAALLTIVTSALQGVPRGFEKPIIGEASLPRVQYYDDALRIDGVGEFLREFNNRQTLLLEHSRTHPPGAVLVYWAAIKLFRYPALIALIFAIASLGLTSVFLNGILLHLGIEPGAARRMVWLLLLLPAMQIYSLASLDALVAAAFLGAIYFLLRRDSASAIAGASAAALASFSMTFASLFLIPVMLVTEAATRRSVRRSLCIIGLVAGCLALAQPALGFNYARAFITASCIENPNGFRLFAEPLNYLATRVQCLVEIAVFAGPFVCYLFWSGRGRLMGPRRRIVNSALLTLLAMFAAGAFHASETGRACMFINPFLLMGIPRVGADAVTGEASHQRLCLVVFGQAMLMQLLGDYFW